MMRLALQHRPRKDREDAKLMKNVQYEQNIQRSINVAEEEMRDGRPDILTAQKVAVRLGGRTIWSGGTFSVGSGEFVTIVGPNGAGKSTLLRLLLGLLSPSAGCIEVFGQIPRRGNSLIGYVPQRRTLDPDLMVRASDFVAMGIDGHKWGIPLPFVSKQHHTLVQEALDAVGATAYAHRAIGRLSGGEQQRLLLAQALLGQPRLLLLDEPLASLDLRNQHAIAQLVAQVARERNITVLLVSHDVNPLLPFTNRVLYVAQGQIAIGKPDEIITTEHLTQMYGAPVEVMRDSRGRVLVFGLDSASSCNCYE
jgi:zinc/manganese transport system ATP-binding protein